MSLSEKLKIRSQSSCELCRKPVDLSVYSSMKSPHTEENSAYLCQKCIEQIEKIKPLEPHHWRLLNESMWSEYTAVQFFAYRMIVRLSKTESWASDLLDQMNFLEDSIKADALKLEEDHIESSEVEIVTKDSNGVRLLDGDSVTLIKDLDVKGANFTAKRGTLVKNIVLSSNPEHIEGRVNGTQIVLLTCYLKKV